MLFLGHAHMRLAQRKPKEIVMRRTIVSSLIALSVMVGAVTQVAAANNYAYPDGKFWQEQATHIG